MAIQQWTMNQWRLAHEIIQSNEWKLHRYIDKDKNEQINVSLTVFGSLEVVNERERMFGGRVSQRRWESGAGQFNRKGAIQPFSWLLRDEELDDFLENLWIILSKEDPHDRLTDVRQAQNIRRRVREGNSYPFYDPRSAKGHREGLGIQRPRRLRNL